MWFFRFAIIFIIFSIFYDMNIKCKNNKLMQALFNLFLRLCKSIIILAMIYTFSNWFVSLF